jgi:serine/threonine protein kinase
MKVIDKKRFMSLAVSHKDEIMAEVEIMRSLDHENVVKILDVFDSEKTLYIVLELVTGGNLGEFVAEHGGVPEDAARKLFIQAAGALGYLHSKGIAHRDLKVCPISFLSASPRDD